VKARIAFACVLGASLVTSARPALAHDPERAAALFKEGRDALEKGDYQTACGRFAESESLDPRVGTLINLALCEEGRHKLAAAHQYWQQATDFARATADPRTDYCVAQLTRLDPRVPRLTIKLDGTAPPDTVVTRDGIDFGASSLGLPLPVEVGPHRITARATGHTERGFDVDLPEGESIEMVVAPGPLSGPVVPAEPPRGSSEGSEPAATSSLRPVAYVVGGLGIVGLVVGTYFGVRAAQSAGDTSGHCDGDVCDATGISARHDEQLSGNAATIALVSGATLLTGGAALRVLTPSPAERPHVRRNLAYVLGGAGIVAVGVGAVLGGSAMSDMSSASNHCTGNVCDHAGAADRRDAVSAGNVSTMAFVTGGVLLGGGALLWLTAPRASASSTGIGIAPAVATNGASLRLEGTW
jgi:hypothetical protein